MMSRTISQTQEAGKGNFRFNIWLERGTNRGIFADVIVYIFAHLHTALRTEGKVLDIN